MERVLRFLERLLSKVRGDSERKPTPRDDVALANHSQLYTALVADFIDNKARTIIVDDMRNWDESELLFMRAHTQNTELRGINQKLDVIEAIIENGWEPTGYKLWGFAITMPGVFHRMANM